MCRWAIYIYNYIYIYGAVEDYFKNDLVKDIVSANKA